MNEPIVTEIANYSTAAYSIVLAVFGFAGTFLTQIVKKLAKQEGNRALILSWVISITLATVATWVAGDFSLQTFNQSVAAIFSLSTIVYRLLLSNDRLINSEI